MNAIYLAEKIPNRLNFNVLGFSQGVSVAMRWIARCKIQCAQLVIYAGSIPTELTKTDFDFIDHEKTKVINIVGTQDEYLTEQRMKQEHEKMQLLFGKNYSFRTFEGRHELSRKVLTELTR